MKSAQCVHGIRRCNMRLVDFHRSSPGVTYIFPSRCDRLVCRPCQFHCVVCNETCCKIRYDIRYTKYVLKIVVISDATTAV